MTADDIVAAFVGHLADCTSALHSRFSAAARLHPGEPLMLLPIDGGPGQRFGSLPGVGDFELHGQGCRVDLLSGEVIDFDWDQSGREVFDGWRLQRFARSLDVSGLPESALVEAARRDARFEEVRPGWFAIARP
jgi:hypothetical protein